jgi:hypothetical protein
MSSEKAQNQLKLVCHPYLFALKEGRKIKEDLLDFSLLLLQRNCTEIIKSPKSHQTKVEGIVSSDKLFQTSKIKA